MKFEPVPDHPSGHKPVTRTISFNTIVSWFRYCSICVSSFGNGIVRGIHRFCTLTESEGVHAALDGPPYLRRLLGLFLLLHFQLKRHGQSRHATRR